MEYKIYYLTSIYDYNVPMYIGVTKQKLEKRLNVHKCIKFKTVDICKRTNWIKSRNKKITIHLIQTCEKEEEAIKAEQFWINFWKKINENLKNSNKTVLYSKGNSGVNREEINTKIKNSIIHTRKPVLWVNKNSDIIKEFDSVKEASKFFKVKDETIIKNAKDIRSCYKSQVMLVYKNDYVKGKDYSYKLINKRKPNKNKTFLPELAYEKIRKQITVKNLITEEIITYKSYTEFSKIININSSYITFLIKNNKKQIRNYLIL